MSENTSLFLKNITALLLAFVTALGSLKIIPSEQVDAVTKFITEGVVALGGILVTGAILWKQMSHKEAMNDDKIEVVKAGREPQDILK